MTRLRGSVPVLVKTMRLGFSMGGRAGGKRGVEGGSCLVFGLLSFSRDSYVTAYGN